MNLSPVSDAALDSLEERFGKFYVRSHDLRMAWPATHVGNGRTGCVSISHSPLGALVNWKVQDEAIGDVVLHSCERAYAERGRCGAFAAIRRAIKAVKGCGCVHRVRPGDRGPWGAGAFALEG